MNFIFIFFSSNKCDNICIHVKKVHKLRGFRDDTTVLDNVLELQRKFIGKQLSRVNTKRQRKPYQRYDTGIAHPYSKAMQVPQICHLCGKTYASGDSIRYVQICHKIVIPCFEKKEFRLNKRKFSIISKNILDISLSEEAS